MVIQPAPWLSSFLGEAGIEGFEMSFSYEVVRELQTTGGSALIDVLKVIACCVVLRGAGAIAITGEHSPHLSCGCAEQLRYGRGFLGTQEYPLPKLRKSCKPP